MPKTKQTAKKSTGGVSKRQQLVPQRKTNRSETPQSYQPSQPPQFTPDVAMAEVTPPGPDALEVAAGKGGTSGDDNTDEVSHNQPG